MAPPPVYPSQPAGAEEAARYRAILEQQTDLIARFLADGTLLYVNEAYCRFFGRSRDTLVGHAWQPIAHPDDVPMIQAQLARLSVANPVVVIENRVLAAGGEMRWCQFINAVIVGADGHIEAYQSVGRDVTERKTLELRLATALGEVEDLYDNAPCGYWSLDARGVIVRINATALGWLGRARSEVVGRAHMQDFLTDESREVFRQTFPKVMRDGEAHDVEVDLVGRDAPRRISVSATTVRDAHGAFLMTRTVAHDISALHRAEEDLRALTRHQAQQLDLATQDLRRLVTRLESAQDDERRRIASELHDELQQTLSAIQIDAVAARERIGPTPPDVAAILRDIETLSTIALRATRRIVADLRPPALDDLGLVAALEAMVARTDRHAGFRCTLDCDGVDDELLRTRPDVANCVYRVAQEALTNIRKHAQANTVTIRLTEEGNTVRLDIRDDGVGLPEGARGKTGSHGLLGMKYRADALGGRFAIGAAPGGGTLLEFEVPRA